MANTENFNCLSCFSTRFGLKIRHFQIKCIYNLGLAHIFHAGFIVPKQKFWCAQALDANGDDLPPPWTVEYYNSSLEIWPGRGNMTEGKTLGHCVPGCVNYDFDHDFWEATMVTQWDLVCEKSWLKTLAKMILFTGKTFNIPAVSLDFIDGFQYLFAM